jgi:hypothetical protein
MILEKVAFLAVVAAAVYWAVQRLFRCRHEAMIWERNRHPDRPGLWLVCSCGHAKGPFKASAPPARLVREAGFELDSEAGSR